MKTKNILYSLLMATSLTTSLWAESVPVYFGTSHSKGIYRATFDSESGSLSTPVLAAELERPGFIAIHPNRKYLYSTTVDEKDPKMGGVAAYAINEDGSLTFLNRQGSQGKGACHVSVDVMGSCLLVANYGDGSVAALKINTDGSLQPSSSVHQHEGSGAHPKRQKGPHAHSIYSSSDNSYAYAPDLGIDQVVIYELNSGDAELTPAGSAKVPGGARGPRHMKFSAGGRYAYVLNELDSTLSVFEAIEGGQLEYLNTYDTLPEGMDKTDLHAAEIRIHPGGKHLYASIRDLTEQGRDCMAVFTLRDSGAVLKRVQVRGINVHFPRNFNIDPSGRWMLIGGQRSHDIAILPIDPGSGKLGEVKSNLPFEGGPICIEFLD